jgi:hypothetical protein
LLLPTLTSQAEPYYPTLKKTEVDSLRSKLRRSGLDTNRVKLLQLSNDLTSRYYYLQKLDTIAFFLRQAQALSNALHYIGSQIDSNCAPGHLLRKGPGGREVVLHALARSQQQHDRRREAIG